MGIISNKIMGGGILDVIRCDEPSYLVWKWHPEGTKLGNNRKENSIRYGSSLRVKDGELAVFVHKKDGRITQDYLEGPYDGILKTENLPMISNLIGIAYEGGTPFQAEIYFINLANVIQVKFGVPYFDVYDPRFLDYAVPVAVRGTISFKITNYMSFISLHRLDTFTLEDFQKQIRDAVCKYVKGVVSNIPEEKGIPVVQLERKILEINEEIEEKIGYRLTRDFGVSVLGVDISAIEFDKTSEGYMQLKTVTQDISTQKIKAQTDVEIKEMKDSQRLGVFERASMILTGKKLNVGSEAIGESQSGNVLSGGLNSVAGKAGSVVGAVGQNITSSMSDLMGKRNSEPSITEDGVDEVVEKNNKPSVSVADEILKFKQLLDMGVLTQEEFDAKKKELLGL